MNTRKSKSEILRYSLDYQLLSPYTKFILTDEVDDENKIYSLPEVHRVRSMHRAAGIASRSSDIIDVPTFMRSSSVSKDEEISANKRLLETIKAIPSYYVKNSILLINGWFLKNGESCLPTTVSEILYIGIIREEVLDVLSDSNIIEFILALYDRYIIDNGTFILDPDFIQMVEDYR